MPNAARLTDNTAHGGVVSAPGCVTVLVDTLPAARVGDQHLCPASTGPVPHVGGPIVQGARDVKIGTGFASRATDNAVCTGPIDVLVGGSRDVLIGGATLTFHTSGKGGNSLVACDPETKTVYIESFLEYSGPGATQAYADAAKKTIQDMWNGPCDHAGQIYQVQVNVHTSVNPGGPPSPGFDPIIVDPATPRANQALFGNGPGHQDPANLPPNFWTAAHEYGHSLGLPDEYHDPPGGGASIPDDPTKTNNIMSQVWKGPDGTIPHPYPNQYAQILKNYGC